jgi:hypothetical protein
MLYPVICLGLAVVNVRHKRITLVQSGTTLGYPSGTLLLPGGQLQIKEDGKSYLQTLGVPGLIASTVRRFWVPERHSH